MNFKRLTHLTLFSPIKVTMYRRYGTISMKLFEQYTSRNNPYLCQQGPNIKQQSKYRWSNLSRKYTPYCLVIFIFELVDYQVFCHAILKAEKNNLWLLQTVYTVTRINITWWLNLVYCTHFDFFIIFCCLWALTQLCIYRPKLPVKIDLTKQV